MYEKWGSKSQSSLTYSGFLPSPARGWALRKETEMTRKNTRAWALVSILAIGMGAGVASAAGPHQGHNHGHRHNASCGCDVQQVAGTLTINGCSTTIRTGRGMNAQIVRAFRKEGYRAWIEDGCVRVDYGYCKPSVRWRTDDYAAQLRWAWGDLHVSLRKVYRNAHHPVRVKRAYRPYYRSGICR